MAKPSKRPPHGKKAGTSPAADAGEPDKQVTVMLPASVVRAMRMRAAEQDETIRTVVLRALLADGFKVPAEEIADRRIAANKRRG